MSLTQRERYIETLLFGSPDVIPFDPGEPREKTLKRWYAEGLPEGCDWFVYLCDTIGIERNQLLRSGLQLDVNFRMHPTFEERVLEHKEGHYVVQDWMGNITEISDEYDVTYIREPKDFVTRKWHKFPVQTPHDFDNMKKRYNPADPVRYPADYEERVRTLKKRDHVSSLNFSGPFWQLREWCGFEPLCMLFLTDPDFVDEMIVFWTDFVLQTMAKALDSGVVDRIWISEDMAFKEKSMISPGMVREFLLPAWDKWISQAQQAGVPIVDMDSDGMVAQLIPLWIEAGFNVCDPIEVAAGNDIHMYRDRFGQKMAYRMGVDKRCIAAGPESIETEMHRLLPVIKKGGYIPGCDHGVPYDISWQNFVYYARRLAELTGWL
jgi:uroporphyrinogen decarboxylase